MAQPIVDVKRDNVCGATSTSGEKCTDCTVCGNRRVDGMKSANCTECEVSKYVSSTNSIARMTRSRTIFKIKPLEGGKFKLENNDNLLEGLLK